MNLVNDDETNSIAKIECLQDFFERDIEQRKFRTVTVIPWTRIIEASISILLHLSYSGIFRSGRQIHSI
jgi:hypothetical protein